MSVGTQIDLVGVEIDFESVFVEGNMVSVDRVAVGAVGAAPDSNSYQVLQSITNITNASGSTCCYSIILFCNSRKE